MINDPLVDDRSRVTCKQLPMFLFNVINKTTCAEPIVPKCWRFNKPCSHVTFTSTSRSTSTLCSWWRKDKPQRIDSGAFSVYFCLRCYQYNTKLDVNADANVDVDANSAIHKAAGQVFSWLERPQRPIPASSSIHCLWEFQELYQAKSWNGWEPWGWRLCE